MAMAVWRTRGQLDPRQQIQQGRCATWRRRGFIGIQMEIYIAYIYIYISYIYIYILYICYIYCIYVKYIYIYEYTVYIYIYMCIYIYIWILWIIVDQYESLLIHMHIYIIIYLDYPGVNSNQKDVENPWRKPLGK